MRRGRNGEKGEDEEKMKNREVVGRKTEEMMGEEEEEVEEQTKGMKKVR